MKLAGFGAPTGVWCWHQKVQAYTQFAPGSFTDAIKGGLIRLNIHHDLDRLLSRQDAGTLRVWEEPAGLFFEANIEDSPLAEFLKHAIAFGFAKHVCPCVIAEGEDAPTKPGEPRRIRQHRVLGADLAILIANQGHYPTTWIKVLA